MRIRFLLLVLLISNCNANATTSAVDPDSSRHTGFVVALAWPKAWAKQAGDGYDQLMKGLGFNDSGFYRVGHAALILVNNADSSCHFFDFGRYHTPFGYGRVRSKETDHELSILLKAKFSGRQIENLDEILCEVQSNKNNHGSGPMYASYVRVNFQKAYDAAREWQNRGSIPYGPFEKEGLNCSRFVREIILAGEPNWAHALRLEVVPMITPTTLYPVSALYHWTKVPGCLDDEAEALKQRLSSLPDSLFHSILPEPSRPVSVPSDAQWLAGESAGSWFHIEKKSEDCLVARYSRNGNMECLSKMQAESGIVWTDEGVRMITYPSNCAVITLLVNGEKIKLIAVE